MGTSCVLITIAVLRVIAAFKLSRSSRLRAAIGQKKKIVILDYSEKGQRIHILHIRFPCSDYKKGS